MTVEQQGWADMMDEEEEDEQKRVLHQVSLSPVSPAQGCGTNLHFAKLTHTKNASTPPRMLITRLFVCVCETRSPTCRRDRMNSSSQ